MSLSDILPIILIIVFWAILFVCVFAFWRMNSVLSASAESEQEAHGDQATRATSAH